MERIQSFAGFAEGGLEGEHFYSMNFSKTRNGMSNNAVLSNISSKLNTPLPTLQNAIRYFTQARPGGAGSTYMYGMDGNGYIYSSDAGANPYVLTYRSSESCNGGGLITDPIGRLLYIGNRYIGVYDGTADYTAGTISVTNGSASVVGTGTVFTGMAGKMLRVNGTNEFYKVLSVTDATHLTLATNYTGTTNASANYKIFVGWSDRGVAGKGWDLGSGYDGTDIKPADTMEDWVLIGTGNKIQGINTTDDSPNSQLFDLPPNFKIVTFRVNKNGVLIGATVGSQSVIVLWDGDSPRSNVPWIWIDEEVKGIFNYGDSWIVSTNKGIYFSTGYTLEPIKNPVLDATFDGVAINAGHYSGYVIGDYFHFPARSGISRFGAGLYRLNLKTGLFKLTEFSNKELDGGIIGGLGLFNANGNFLFHVSYESSGIGSFNVFIDKFLESFNPRAIYISEKLGGNNNNMKVSEALKLYAAPLEKQINALAYSFDISLKIYNFSSQLYNSAQTKSASSQADQIAVDGTTYANVKRNVGDEVTICNGVNAGEMRHIKTITGKGTSGEIWTLDSVLPNNTEQSVTLLIMPFKKVRTFNFTNLDSIKDLYFDIQKKSKGRSFLLKLVIENATFPIEIIAGEFFYNDLMKY